MIASALYCSINHHTNNNPYIYYMSTSTQVRAPPPAAVQKVGATAHHRDKTVHACLYSGGVMLIETGSKDTSYTGGGQGGRYVYVYVWVEFEVEVAVQEYGYCTILVQCVLFHVECCIRQLSSLSIILFNITSITHNHHTNIYSLIKHKHKHKHPIISLFHYFIISLSLSPITITFTITKTLK